MAPVSTTAAPASGHLRAACSEPCEVLSFDGYRERGTIWDLGERGVYAALPAPLPPIGRTVLLTFVLADDGAAVTCEARVEWHNPPSALAGSGAVKASLPPGCGLAFSRIAPEDAERISARIAACDVSRRLLERILERLWSREEALATPPA
jgi:hypothetical protein